MALTPLFVAIVIFAGLFPGISSRIGIEMSPSSNVGTLTDSVTISCVPENDNKTTDVILIELKKGESYVVALIRQNSDITYGANNDMHVTAIGEIKKGMPGTYFDVTIRYPQMKDSGTYTCIMYYLNEGQVVAETRTSKQLTWNEPSVNTLNDAVRDLLQKISSLEKYIADSGQTDYALLERLNRLEAQTKNQSREIGDLNDNDAEMMDALDEIKKNVTSKKLATGVNPQDEKAMKDYQAQLLNMERFEVRLDKLNRTATAADADNQLTKERIKALENKVKGLQEETKGNNYSAFAVTNVAGMVFTLNANVVFPDILLNECGDYDNTTGIYTAREDGIYAFHAATHSLWGGYQLGMELRANTKVLAKLHVQEKNFQDQTSISTVARLQAGDKVSLVVVSSTGGNVFPAPSYFSGYFIARD